MGEEIPSYHKDDQLQSGHPVLVPSFHFALNSFSANSWLRDFGPVPSLVVPLEAVTGEGRHYTEVTV